MNRDWILGQVRQIVISTMDCPPGDCFEHRIFSQPEVAERIAKSCSGFAKVNISVDARVALDNPHSHSYVLTVYPFN